MRLPGSAEIFAFFSNMGPFTPAHILCMARGTVPAMHCAINSLTRHNSPLSGASSPNPRSATRVTSPRTAPTSPVPLPPGLNDSISSLPRGTTSLRGEQAEPDQVSLTLSYATAYSTAFPPSRSTSAPDTNPLFSHTASLATATATPFHSLVSSDFLNGIDETAGSPDATAAPYDPSSLVDPLLGIALNSSTVTDSVAPSNHVGEKEHATSTHAVAARENGAVGESVGESGQVSVEESLNGSERVGVDVDMSVGMGVLSSENRVKEIERVPAPRVETDETTHAPSATVMPIVEGVVVEE